MRGSVVLVLELLGMVICFLIWVAAAVWYWLKLWTEVKELLLTKVAAAVAEAAAEAAGDAASASWELRALVLEDLDERLGSRL